SCAHRSLHSFPTRRSSDLLAKDAFLLLLHEVCGAFEAGYAQKAGGKREVECVPESMLRQNIRLCVYQIFHQERMAILHMHQTERSEEHTSELQSLAYLVCR